MKSIYLLSFKHYHAQFSGSLIFERIGNYPIVKVTRQWGDLPFWKYFKMRLFHEISHWFHWQVEIIEYEIRVTAGMEKDVTWNKRDDGLFEPYDTVAEIHMPHLARKEPPPTRRVYKNGRVAVTKQSNPRHI